MRRRDFILEQTRLGPVPLVPELVAYRAETVSQVWFETARYLNDDDTRVPFWCVPWAGGQALARYVLDHPELVRGKRVLDFACGGGIVGIAAAKAGGIVRAVDIDPLAAETTALNREANGVELTVETTNVAGRRLPGIDVVLAGDVWYEPKPSARFERWFRSLDALVLTADSGRPYAPSLVRELARYEVPTPFELEARTSRTARVLSFDVTGAVVR